MARDQPPADRDPMGPDDETLVFTRQSVREVDRLAVAEYGIPSIVLMENAGLHLAEVALDLAQSEPPRILIVCGPGNNGGDGLCAARHLHNEGALVEIVLAGPGSVPSGDGAIHLHIVKQMGLKIIPTDATSARTALDTAARRLRPDVIIDALLGTGFERPVEEPIAGLIRGINALSDAGTTVVCADLPSGLDCDRGVPLGEAVKAGTTVSFVGLKAGFLRLSAQEYIGDVIVADIGAPRELVERLGQRLADHEEHDGPDPRPGHGPGPNPGRPERG